MTALSCGLLVVNACFCLNRASFGRHERCVARRVRYERTHRSRTKWLVHALVTSVLGCMATSARADESAGEPLRLSWVRAGSAESCPDARSVVAQVRERLGRDPFSDGASNAAEILVERRDGQFSARIALRSEHGTQGERTLTTDQECDALVSAVALALAIQLDPNAALRPRGSVEVPAPDAEPQVVQATSPSPRPRVEAAAKPAAPSTSPASEIVAATNDGRERGTLSAGALLTSNLVPGAGVGATLGAELTLARRLHASLTAGYVAESRTSDGRFGFGLSMAGVGLCGDAVATRWITLDACAAVLPGAIHAVVYADLPTRPGERFWLGASATAVARVNVLRSLFLEVAGGAIFPMIRHHFSVTGVADDVFRQPAAVPLGQLAVGTSFR